MKKYLSKIVIGLMLILTGSVLTLIITKNVNNVYDEESNLGSKKNINMLSMMLEQTAGAGDYEMVTQSEWPTDGYVFNSTLSKCENGGELSWDDTNKRILMSGNTSDKCYIYFDKKMPSIAFTLDDTTYYAEEGMTYLEWSNSDYNTFGYYFDEEKKLYTSDTIDAMPSKSVVDKIVASDNYYSLFVAGKSRLGNGTIETTDGEVLDVDMSDYVTIELIIEKNLKSKNVTVPKSYISLIQKECTFSFIMLFETNIINSIPSLELTLSGIRASNVISSKYLNLTDYNWYNISSSVKSDNEVQFTNLPQDINNSIVCITKVS